jgi:hypothetical protein
VYLPTATDSVLCDYVLVMVGNKKTRSQIANDLEVISFAPFYYFQHLTSELDRHFLGTKKAKNSLSGFGNC